MAADVDIDKLWDFDKPAESEARFKEALVNARGSLRVEILTQLARAQGLQRKFAQAHDTLDEAESLCGAEMMIARIRLLLERGRVFNSAGMIEKAKPLFIAAWELAGANGPDYYAVDAAHMLGICTPADEAIAWNEKALVMAEKSADPRTHNWAGPLYNNLGWTYHDKGDYARALELFEAGLKFRLAKGQRRPIEIARYAVARAMRSLGRVSQALAMQEELYSQQKAAGEMDGYVLEELGECHLLLGQANEARGFFALAHAELSKDPWLVEHEAPRLARIKELGEIP
jgi:tetratricopeptide (TPR) repeat protein